MFEWDKHSSLFDPFESYEGKVFLTLAPVLSYKTTHSRNVTFVHKLESLISILG
jgi:hypothetical protein